MPAVATVGQMKHRLVLQRAVVTQDPFGQEVRTWEDQGEFYAAVEPMTGVELMAARMMEATTAYKVTMWANVGEILATDRFLWTTRNLVLNIVACFVSDDNARWFVHCSVLAGEQP